MNAILCVQRCFRAETIDASKGIIKALARVVLGVHLRRSVFPTCYFTYLSFLINPQLVCFCGRTVYEPPIPCGTSIECHYPCPRPPPPCNHPSTLHSCHFDDVSCPPCPFLAAKQCACGKKIVPNTRCSLETEKVSCGTVCGKFVPHCSDSSFY